MNNLANKMLVNKQIPLSNSPKTKNAYYFSLKENKKKNTSK